MKILHRLVPSALSGIIQTAGGFLVAIVLGLGSTAAFADINGPITVSATHLGTSEAISFGFGAQRIFDPGSIRERSRVEVSAVTVKRFTDEHSPYYLLAALQGRTLAEVVITRGTLTLTLRNAIVSGYEVESAAMAEIRNRYRRIRSSQIEQVTIAYEEITYQVDGEEIDYDVLAGV
jgi:type VI protein secretion system component Hcp